jgi:hypothetical protein
MPRCGGTFDENCRVCSAFQRTIASSGLYFSNPFDEFFQPVLPVPTPS